MEHQVQHFPCESDVKGKRAMRNFKKAGDRPVSVKGRLGDVPLVLGEALIVRFTFDQKHLDIISNDSRNEYSFGRR